MGGLPTSAAGFTGTEVCADPERELITITLTNRVYPVASAESEDRIHAFRQAFNNAVAAIFPLPPAL
jgi:hypothetical protein